MAAESTVRIIFLGDSAQAVRSVSRLEASFSSLGTAAKLGAAAVGIALVGAMAAATKAAIDFDRSMRNVNSIAKLSEKQFADLEKRVLALAGPTAQSPKVLADGLYDIVSSGFKANDGIKILAVSAKAATAGMTNTATASKAVVAVLNAYHLSADKARNVSSLLFTEVNKGVNTFEELATNIGDTAPLAAALKIPFSDVSAGLALITLHGTSMAEAATQMSRVMADLLKPSKGLSAELKSLGYENGQAAIAAHGFIPLIQQLSQAADGSAAKTASWFQNIRSLRGMLNLTGPNLAKFNQFADQMAASFQKGGADVAAFNEQAKSISVQWAMAKDALIAAAIPIGQLLFPALTKAAAGVADLANAVNQYMPQIKAGSDAAAQGVAQAWTQYAIPGLRYFAAQTSGVVTAVKQSWPEIRATITSVGGSIMSIFRSVGDIIKALFPVLRALGPEFKVAFGLIIIEARIMATVLSLQFKLVAAVIKAVAPVVVTIVNGINQGFRALAHAAVVMAGAIVNAVHVIIGVFGKIAPVVKIAFDITPIGVMIKAIQTLIGWIQTLIGWFHKIPSFVHTVFSSTGSAGPPGGPRGPGPPAHAAGGFVAGQAGSPQLILAHAGEVILNPMQQAAFGGAAFFKQAFGFTEGGSSFAAGGIVGGAKRPHHGHPVRPRYKTASRRARGAMKNIDHINQEESDLDRAYGQLTRQYQIDGTLDVTEIDSLIAERNKMLALLEEEKKALVKAIKDLKKAIAAMVTAVKEERKSIAATAKKLADEQKKKKPNASLVTKYQNAISAGGTRIGNLTSGISDFQRAIGDENLNLKHQLPFDVRDVQLDISELQQERSTITAVPAPDVAALLAEIARLTQALDIQGAQAAIIGTFAKGTLSVPETGLALVHAGEQIVPAGQVRGGPVSSTPPVVNVYVDDAMGWLKPYIRAEAVNASDAISVRIGQRATERARSGRY